MRKIIVYITISADGYIARANGSVDWLDRPRIKGDYGSPKFLRSIDTILWGRKTYQQALTLPGGGGGVGFGANIRNYVFSTKRGPAAEGVEWVTDPVDTFAKGLRSGKGKDNEFMIHVVPTMIGEGIPLLAPRHRTVPLRLKSTRKFSDGVVLLHYGVVRLVRRIGAKAAGRV